MLYEIKFLKAPWPAGAKVGDVVDMPYLPAWAQGKCSIASDGARATVEFPDPVAPDGVNRPLSGDSSGQPLPTLEAINLELADLREKLAAAELETAKLRKQADVADEAYDALFEQKEAATADAADLREKLAAAEAAAVDAAANTVTKTTTKANGK